jgi:hypothetical protein
VDGPCYVEEAPINDQPAHCTHCQAEVYDLRARLAAVEVLCDKRDATFSPSPHALVPTRDIRDILRRRDASEDLAPRVTPADAPFTDYDG